jgi:glycosyltransferase involved in cell wall biosynthesis
LAKALQQRGHEVLVLVYNTNEHFAPALQAAGISRQEIPPCSHLRRLFALRNILRQGWQDVVLAFMTTPSFYAELAGLPHRHWGLVVSERGFEAENVPVWRRRLHRFADYVVTNSHANRLRLERVVPSLNSRIITIYNTIDLEKWHPTSMPVRKDGEELRLVVLASYRPVKNAKGLIEGLAKAKAKYPQIKIRLDWYGGYPNLPNGLLDYSHRDVAESLVIERGVQGYVSFHDIIPDAIDAYIEADAVILPSLHEGLPNVVCEAMACGRAVLHSNVCDAGNLVIDGINGFLFDPTSVDSIAEALLKFSRLSSTERKAMGLAGRKMAERIFALEPVLERWEAVLAAAIEGRHEILSHWVEQVPASAIHSANIEMQ